MSLDPKKNKDKRMLKPKSDQMKAVQEELPNGSTTKELQSSAAEYDRFVVTSSSSTTCSSISHKPSLPPRQRHTSDKSGTRSANSSSHLPPNSSIVLESAAVYGFGRRGDSRMHKAVAFRLDNPKSSLFEALEQGGFSFPLKSSKVALTDRDILDEDGVQLSQRKNQLGRRLRMIREKKRGTENAPAKDALPRAAISQQAPESNVFSNVPSPAITLRAEYGSQLDSSVVCLLQQEQLVQHQKLQAQEPQPCWQQEILNSQQRQEQIENNLNLIKAEQKRPCPPASDLLALLPVEKRSRCGGGLILSPASTSSRSSSNYLPQQGNGNAVLHPTANDLEQQMKMILDATRILGTGSFPPASQMFHSPMVGTTPASAYPSSSSCPPGSTTSEEMKRHLPNKQEQEECVAQSSKNLNLNASETDLKCNFWRSSDAIGIMNTIDAQLNHAVEMYSQGHEDFISKCLLNAGLCPILARNHEIHVLLKRKLLVKDHPAVRGG